MKLTSMLLTGCLALMACDVVNAQPPSYEGWKLVWADEFEKDGQPDPAKWTYEPGFVRNEELQWYQPINAWSRNGLLVIEGRRERKRNPNYDPNGRS